MIIADRNALRSSLCCQLATLLQQSGLTRGQYSFHTHRTLEDGLAHLFCNPPFKMDLIVCWDTQPAREAKIHGRPACDQRTHEAARMATVLANFQDLKIPVIGIPADPAFIGEDPDPISTPGTMQDSFPNTRWFQQDGVEMIVYSDPFGPTTTRHHRDDAHLTFIDDLAQLVREPAA
jgi:hypothetical protein